MHLRAKVGIYGSVLTILIYFLAPGTFKFFSFLLPAFALSFMFRSDRQYFNMSVFLLASFIGFLLPSSLITFDASQVYAYTQVIETSLDWTVSLLSMIITGIVLFYIVAIIIALYSGQASQAGKAFVRVVLIVLSVLLVSFAINLMPSKGGSYLAGLQSWISETFTWLLNLPGSIGDALNDVQIVGDFMPNLPSTMNYDSLQSDFFNMSYTQMIFSISSIYPLVLSGVCLFVGILYLDTKWRKNTMEEIGKWRLGGKKKTRVPTKYFSATNLNLVVFGTIIVVAAFFIFLSFPNLYNVDQQSWMYMGYFGLYLFLAILPTIFLNLRFNLYYKRINSWFEVVKGTLFGFIGLYILTELFFSQMLFSAYSVNNYNTSIGYVLNQFVFVAPAESMMFHIFLPSLITGYIIYKGIAKVQKTTEQKQNERILDALERAEVYHRKQGDMEKLAKTLAYQNSVQQELERLQTSTYANFNETSILKRKKAIAIFFAGVLISNFLFSMAHWFVLIPDGVGFIDFWVFGTGMVYMSGGVWFTIIGYRYNWLSAILCHALYNTRMVLIILIFGGMAAL